MRHCILISPTDSKLNERLNSSGIDTVFTKAVDGLLDYEKYHADIGMLRIKDTAFISQSSEYLKELIKPYFESVVVCDKLCGKYPQNVLLNAALVGNSLICRARSTAKEVLSYAEKSGIKIINVNQGYAKCSTLVLNDNAIITADVGIYKKAQENGIRALLISEGSIYLDGKTYGFIGGAGVRIGDKVIFFGDINTHPDHKLISEFIALEGLSIISLIKERQLVDLGGAVVLK